MKEAKLVLWRARALTKVMINESRVWNITNSVRYGTTQAEMGDIALQARIVVDAIWGRDFRMGR